MTAFRLEFIGNQILNLIELGMWPSPQYMWVLDWDSVVEFGVIVILSG